jgi:hypothetical protein
LVIGCFFISDIGGYQWLLVAILLMAINGLLVAIDGY